MINNLIEINNDKIYNEMKDFVSKDVFNINNHLVECNGEVFDLSSPYKSENLIKYNNPLIYGKNVYERVVSCEILGTAIILYLNDGNTIVEPVKYYVFSSKKINNSAIKLQGNQTYKYAYIFNEKYQQSNFIKNNTKRHDLFVIWDDIDAYLTVKGITFFKGMQLNELKVLSFDIETDGLVKSKDSTIYLISNSFQDGKKETVKKLFSLDNYDNVGEMIEDWCKWVQEKDPSVLVGHNIFGYDLPYIQHVADLHQVRVNIGKNDSPMSIRQKPREYRVDGSQTWEYNPINIPGRNIIDTMFLAVKYDVGKSFPSWGLKPIVKSLGLEKEGRQHYDASLIKKNWNNLVEREKIKNYAIDDGEDSLKLFNQMVPAFFYMNQSIPKTFQNTILSASGSWINSILLRSYLQDKKSIPKSSEAIKVHGGISYGNPGIYKNVFKIDVKSMYPSIILQYKLYPKDKDVDQIYYKLVEYFTLKRFEYKDLHKSTKDDYYDNMQSAFKIFINSMFGLMGTPGLNFNDFSVANEITHYGREVLKSAIEWSTGKPINYWWSEYDLSKDTEEEEDFDE